MALTKINASVIANNTIAVGNIADNSVDATKIASNSILTRHIDDNQVTTDQIAANTIATANIADNAVDGTKIASNSILTRHIDDDQVTGDQLADNIAIAGTLAVAGDANFDSGTLFVDVSANKVGVGTDTPSTLLHLGGTAPGDSIIRQDSTSSGTNWEIGERAAGKWQIFEDDNDSIVATFMSTGNVGIGDTSPGAKLDVNSGTTNTMAHFHSTDDNGFIELKDDDTTGYIGVQNDYVYIGGAPSTNTQNLVINDGNGKVGIGTTSPNEPLTIRSSSENINCTLLEIGNDLHATNTKDAWMKFVCGAAQNDNSWAIGAYPGSFRFSYLETRGTAVTTASAEKMRLTSNGGLNLGTTSGASAGGIQTYVGDNDEAIDCEGPARVNFTINSDESGGNRWYFRTAGSGNFGSGNGDLLVLKEDGTQIMKWDLSSMTIVGNFDDTSDVALKENITDLIDATAKIKALQPRTFDWKDKNKTQGTNGFIAQEVETVLPKLVHGDNYDPENPHHGHKAINTSGLLAVAIKAIQEQQTIIDDLKARIETLEG